MNTALIIPFLTAFGIGSITTALIQHWFTTRAKKDARSFAERKEAYVGLLQAYHRAAVENTDAAAKEFAYWHMRCDLVAPLNVRTAIQSIIETNESMTARSRAHEQLQSALRSDLSISQ